MKWFDSISARTYLLVLVALGTVLRFWDIAKSSIWHDEGYTMMLAPMDPVQIVERTARDVHPPLYYLTLHYWMLIFGNSETAARGLSAVLMLGVIPLTYLLMRRLWDERAARVAALLVTAGPFLIRYSQEARMYGMVAFFLLLATYCLVRALDGRNWLWWAGYSLSIAAALYTHYYSVFMIVAHWGYMAARTNRSKRTGLLSKQWWIANIAAAALFVPWLPSAYHQFTRVQASFWIPPVDATTLPYTILQFVFDGSPDGLPGSGKVLIGLIFAAALAAAFMVARKRRLSLWLLSLYCLTGPVLVFLLSFKRPIYVDRYFVFAAIGFYCLLAVYAALLPRRLQAVAVVVFLALFAGGINQVHVTANHQMRVIGQYVTSHYQPGDEILSGELYTFFDFSYYNHTGQQTKLWSKGGVNGYGESSLIYDRADQIVVKRLEDIHPASGHLWVVGKPGKKDYYDKVPASWIPVGAKVIAGSCAVQEYQVPRGGSAVALQ